MEKQTILDALGVRYARINGRATYIGTYTDVNKGSLLTEQVNNRNSKGWVKAQYIVACNDNSNESLDKYIAGWKLLSTLGNQYLLIEINAGEWQMYGPDGAYMGDNDFITAYFAAPQQGGCIGTWQQVFYGAPGTGKSHTINQMCARFENYRVTFHPDSDYSSFVGAYKPVTKKVPLYTSDGHVAKDADGHDVLQDKIVYRYVFQSFLKAYVAAWREQQKASPAPVFLVIEEINRGNCAQVFGDIFQLLDRNEAGFSEYPVNTEEELAIELGRELSGLVVPHADSINAMYAGGKDVVSMVKDGSLLLLPGNLYIWATMNTSDQSLFPIDSAFKRRWEWKYMKIKPEPGCVVEIRFANGHKYDWWQFVSAINDRIEGGEIQQEDKKLGFFFAKGIRQGDGVCVISAEAFLSKVIFYLYNDVFKDFGFEEDFFMDDQGRVMTFASYFDDRGNVDEARVERFVANVIGASAVMPPAEGAADENTD